MTMSDAPAAEQGGATDFARIHLTALTGEFVARGLSEALEIAVRTDPGLVRGHNEDSVFANPVRGLVILADGMGGYNAGEVASGMATSFLASAMETSFFDTFPTADAVSGGQSFASACLRESIEKANQAIYNAAGSDPDFAGMGTTLVSGLFHDNCLTVAHVGDSRLYRLRDEALSVMTRDHSLLQEQIDCGMISPEEARFSQNKNLVTRALGVDPAVDPEINEFPVLPGDLYLFCSDGLNDMLPDEEIALALQMLAANPALAATQLVQMANDNGGRDNVSVIVVKVLQPFGGTGKQ